MQQRYQKLLRQEAALAWDISIKLEVRPNHDRLVGGDPDTKGNVSDTIECRRRTSLRHDPVKISRVRGQESYRRRAGFARVGPDRIRSGDGYAG